MRRVLLLVLLGLAAGSPLFASPAGDRAALSRCAREANASLRGLDALSQSCPGIERAVHGLGLDPFLAADWQKTTSARALADLAALADRYSAPRPALHLDTTRLGTIAHTLEPPPAPPSLWERIKALIRAWLEPKTDDQSSWLRFLSHWHVSPQLARLIFETIAGLIVIGVAALVVIELRASGVLGNERYRRSPRGTNPVARSSGKTPFDFDALDSAIPRDRPTLLLRLLVDALTGSRRLGQARNLTCRELVANARFESPRQREQFAEVALLAERVLYGDPELAPAEIPEKVLTEARALHAELMAPPRDESKRLAPRTLEAVS